MSSINKKYFRAIFPRSVRNWLRAPARSLEWFWGEIKYAAGANEIIDMRPGFSPVCHPGVYAFAYNLQRTDPDQVEEFDGFLKCASPGMVLFDIGAHFGLFSLAALHYGGPQAAAVAVDPSPTAARIVKIQARLNKVSERLHVLKASVGDHTGVQSMVAVGILASGYYVSPDQDHAGSELTVTKAVTIDGLAHDYTLKPTHIKIDVEGDEAAVLRGARQTLSRADAPLLFLELHNQIVAERGGDPLEVLNLLRLYGYVTMGDEDRLLDDEDILKKEIVRVIARKA